MPKERQVQTEAVVCWEEILFYLGSQPTSNVEYHLLSTGYQSVDMARNYLSFKFMERAVSDDDTLVMLDDDHLHPKTIVEQLVLWNRPVVGALAFKRKAPFHPVAYVRDPKDHRVKIPKQLPQGLVKVTRIGAAALAIQKQTFDRLARRGYSWPWFRFGYQDWALQRHGEDIYFMDCCEKAGVPVFCDFGLVSPHLNSVSVAAETWQNWLTENAPEWVWNGRSIADELMDTVPEKYIQKSSDPSVGAEG
jgi:hypothetical protein